jgi:molybdate transport system substrate-binding protein
MMKRLLPCCLALALLLCACAAPTPTASSPTRAPTPAPTAPADAQTLTVFAAASLTGAFGEIARNFEAAHPGVTLVFSFGSSQTLRAQIENGAQADVFASANTKEMDTLVTDGDVAADGPRIFVTNQLVVILPAKNPAGLTTLADLTKPGLKIVLAAREVPAGNYSLQVLDKLDAALGAGFKDKVLANVVSHELDVKQVVAKVELGEADAGMAYASDTVAAPDLKKIDIPAENNVIAKYPLAVLTHSRNQDLAQAFAAYVLSAEGQSILQKWGFLPAE